MHWKTTKDVQTSATKAAIIYLKLGFEHQTFLSLRFLDLDLG
jgi:hypothetical protein